jgi:HPt (histidine-containing phosphotransfer) domain-containing protein
MNALPPALMEYQQLMNEMDFQDFIVDLIKTFKDVTPDHLAELKTAFTEKDLEAFKRAAHSLKSSGRTFQLTPLTTLAAELEELTSLDDEKVIEERIQTFDLEVHNAIATLEGFLEELK